MKVALTLGVLQIPPTYFAVSHAEFLSHQHEFRAFALAAHIRDGATHVPVEDFFPFRSREFQVRIRLAPVVSPAMTRGIKRYEPDLIHQHFATWSLPAVHASRMLNVPLLTTVHGYDAFFHLRKRTTALGLWHSHNIERAQTNSTRVLAVSRYLAGVAVAAGFDAARLEVHYQGVDIEKFTPAHSALLREAEPIVVFVGSLSEMKGTHDLVRASRAIHARTPHRLVIIGDGPLEAALKADTVADQHIEMLGALDREQVKSWLRLAQVLVLPTKENDGRREAAGLVLLEAQACGTPVIAYDSGGTREMMDPGISGLLVDEGNVNALSSAIGDVLRLSDASYGEMRESARSFVVNNRSLANSASELHEHYLAITH